ncbi:MAG: B12-binding domain-containing radical SAM protein, partial [Microgenomates group bacterium]
LNALPFIDRELTKWRLYAYENGNYKRTPGTYIMAGRDCWWRANGGCKFCAWTILYPRWQVRSPENVLDEIGQLIEKYHVREIMDDTGTFPVGEWLREFCRGMIKRGYHRQIYFDCNMRFGVLTKKDYQLMAKAGFRFLLYGLESANQETLDRLNKGTKVDLIEKELQMAKKANKEVNGHLEPHVTCMVGYPWETKKQAENTIAMTRNLFDKGLISTLQATIVIPYPGTALFAECEKNGWLKTKNWEDYDMRRPVMKTEMSDEEVLALTQGIYKSFLTPKFLLRKIASARSIDELHFFVRAGKKVWGHLKDFAREKNT